MVTKCVFLTKNGTKNSIIEKNDVIKWQIEHINGLIK